MQLIAPQILGTRLVRRAAEKGREIPHRADVSSLGAGRDPKATWAFPLEAEHWSLTTLREKPIKIGANVVHWPGF